MQPANLLKITTLDESWTDKDIVMLHACFQLLVDFIEQENAKIPTDWNYNQEYAHAKREIDELYAWWQERIKADAEGKIDSIWNDEHFEKDTEMLIRLIKIRKYLWT